MTYRWIILMFGLVMPALLEAQELPSIDSLRKTADAKLIQPAQDVVDAIDRGKNAVIQKVDRANDRARQYVDRASAIAANPLGSLDTLAKLDAYRARLESTKTLIAKKIDSLTQLGLPHERYTTLLDSLNSINPAAQVQGMEDKISQVQSRVEARLNQPAEKVSEKLGLLRKESGGEGNLPADLKIPVPGSQGKLPSTNMNTEGFPSANPNLPNLAGQLPTDDPVKLNTQIPSFETGSIQDGLNEVSEVSEKISGYTEDVKNIGRGDLDQVNQIDKDLMNKIELDEIQVLNENAALLEEQQAMVQSLGNEEAFKKATLARAREIAAKQLASHQNRIAETVDKISEHQKRSGTLLAKAKDLPKRPRKEKKPRVIERFVPGVTLQVQKVNTWFVDVNPTLRYRFRSIFSAGVGWNERIVFDKDFKFYEEGRIYGFRSFYELSIRKGLWIRGDVERMNAFVPISRTHQDIGERKYVWSYMAGIKKDFSFAPGVLGNVQFMYNLYDPKRTSTYFSRFNVRFGFEFPLKTNSKRSVPVKSD